MTNKPTYEDLEQRVKELEKDALKLKLAATAQAKSEDRFKTFIDNLDDIAYETDTSGNITYANKITEAITGVALKDIINRPFLPLFTNESRKIATNVYQKTLNGESLECDLITTSERLCHFKCKPLRNQHNEIIGVFGIGRDITKVRKTEQALNESDSRYKALFENMIDGMAVYKAKDNGENFIFVDLNTAGEKISGVLKDDLIGQSVLDKFPGVEDCGLLKVFRDVWKTGQAVRHPTALYKDNRICHWAKNSVYKLPSGEIVAVYSDETQRKQAEETLKQAHNELEKRIRKRTSELEKINAQLNQEIEMRKQTEKWLKSIFDATRHVSFIITDPNGTEARITEFSRGAEHIFGYSREEVIGKPVKMLHVPEDVAQFPEVIKAMQQKRAGFTGESTMIRRSGEKFKGLFNTVPLFDTKGQLVAALGVSVDISKRVKAEKALMESEERYRAVVESQTEMICRFLPDGTITFVNKAYCRYFDKSREEVIGHKFMPSISKDDREKVFKNIGSLNPDAPIITNEHRVLTADGQINWHRWTYRAIFDRHCNLIEYQAVGSDITEQIHAEETLRKNEAELKVKSDNIEEVNMALKVLLKQRDADKKELQESVVANVKELVNPYIHKLSKSALSGRQKAFLGIIQSNIDDIISPFIGNLSSKYLRFTPTEVQVASLIKHGKTTKDIARLLNLSTETIKFHRKNIRDKLGIKNKKFNLRTFLLSVQ
jgi:PAS domain S-box-containing protein